MRRIYVLTTCLALSACSSQGSVDTAPIHRALRGTPDDLTFAVMRTFPSADLSTVETTDWKTETPYSLSFTSSTIDAMGAAASAVDQFGSFRSALTPDGGGFGTCGDATEDLCNALYDRQTNAISAIAGELGGSSESSCTLAATSSAEFPCASSVMLVLTLSSFDKLTGRYSDGFSVYKSCLSCFPPHSDKPTPLF